MATQGSQHCELTTAGLNQASSTAPAKPPSPTLQGSSGAASRPQAFRLQDLEFCGNSACYFALDNEQHTSTSHLALEDLLQQATSSSAEVQGVLSSSSETTPPVGILTMEPKQNCMISTTPTSLSQCRPSDHSKPRNSLALLVSDMVQEGDQCTVQDATALVVPRRSTSLLKLELQLPDEDHIMAGLIGSLGVDLHMDGRNDCDLLSLGQKRLSLSETRQPTGITKSAPLRVRRSGEARLARLVMKRSEPRMRRRPKQPQVDAGPSSSHGLSACPSTQRRDTDRRGCPNRR